MSHENLILHGFSLDDLAAMADGLESGYDKVIDVGGSPLDDSEGNTIDSTTMAAARFIRAAIADKDAVRRQSLGAAALDDIITHAGNLLSAVDSRIRLAKAEDANQVRMTARLGEQHQGPTDSNESYWNREREVLARIVHQARFARGHKTS